MNNQKQRILILFAHPALQRSRVNKVMIERVRNLDGITFNDLYEAYPEFDIDVQKEQDLLIQHDIIIFHHPFFWYSMPAILREWEDLVLEHGWAYGSEGEALHGKKLMSVITSGGTESAYQKKGYNRFTMREFLAPIEQTAFLCGMDYLPPFIAHGSHAMTADDINKHAEDYRRVIVALRDGRIDFMSARKQTRINSNLEKVIIEKPGK